MRKYFPSFRLTAEGGGVSTTHMCRNDPTSHICLKLEKNEPLFEIKIFRFFRPFKYLVDIEL